MKKLLVIIAVVVGIFSASARDTYSRDVAVLPASARTTLKSNFKADVNHIKIDKEWGKVSEYDVVLNDGTEITFDSKGNWKDIEVRNNASVPTGVFPPAIADYVNKYQKKATIVGIEKKRSGYEVELSNGVEIKFNAEGKFLRYDH